jgi:aminodeoxyfutalosine synthase
MTSDVLEKRAAAGEPFSADDARLVLESPDLTRIGHLGELARRHASGDVITFGRVLEVGSDAAPTSVGEAGEVRLVGAVLSVDEAVDRVRRARVLVARQVLTGFSAPGLFELCGRILEALESCARRLREAGLDAVAECPLDAFGSAEDAVAVVRAVERGGLSVCRLTVDRAALAERLALIARAGTVHAATTGVRAFAPLPRHEPADQPATGYDDVRTVAVARLMCASIPYIQVDWPLYGPKLAQVALLYGANDVDGVASVDSSGLGARRSPLEDIRRQIRAAAGEPVERNGRYERVS